MAIREVSLSEVRANPVALRDVDIESEDFLGIKQSIEQKGFMGAITVRTKVGEDGVTYFEVVDGLQRFTAAGLVGLETINVDIQELDDNEVLEAQILANIHRVETRPSEYTNQLKRILSNNPLMTEGELAKRLGKSTQWIKQRLSLKNIENPEIQNLIDQGTIVLSNAYVLAKLPEEEQNEWVERACTLPPSEFLQICNERVKQIREEIRKGKNAKPPEFAPSMFLRKLKEIKEEIAKGGAAADQIIKVTGCSDPVEAVKLGIAWCLHYDPVSVEQQKIKWEDDRKERAEKKKKRAAERAVEKADKKKKEGELAGIMAERAQLVLKGDIEQEEADKLNHADAIRLGLKKEEEAEG